MDPNPDLETVRAALRDFSEVRAGHSPEATRLEEAIASRLDGAGTIEDLTSQSDFIEMLALLVVLTSCPTSDGNEPGGSFARIHQRISRIFIALAGVRGSAARQHVGRPVFRRRIVTRTGDQLNSPAEPSEHLWRYLNSSVVAEIPGWYSKECIAALVYLLLTDLSRSFRIGDFDATEIPCFLEMFDISDANNRNNIGSLLGEYLGLVRVCFLENYTAPEYTAESETLGNDFSILQNGRKIKYFSVKSICFLGTRYFGSDRTNSTVKNFVSKKDEAVVLLHDCDCPFCEQNPIWKTVVRNVVSDEETDDEAASSRLVTGFDATFGCSRKGEFLSQLDSLRFGVVYLASAKLFYDLRYALSEFDHTVYRGANFRLRRHFIDALTVETQQRLVRNPDGSVTVRTLIHNGDELMPNVNV